MMFKGRKPVLIALASQSGAALVTLTIIQWHFLQTGHDIPLWSKVVAAASTAAIIATLLRSNRGWILFMAALPVLFAGAMVINLPAWIPAGILLFLVLLMSNSIGQRVPLYLSNKETLKKLSEQIPKKEPVRFIDLGCGFATAPRAMARYNTHCDSRFVGIENALGPYLIAKILTRLFPDNRVSVRWGSLWEEPLGDYDIAYAFLSPHPMSKLFEKTSGEMRQGSKLISNSFEVPGAPPDHMVPVKSGRATSLLIWYFPRQKETVPGNQQE